MARPLPPKCYTSSVQPSSASPSAPLLSTPAPSYLDDINFLERMGRTDSSPRRAVLKVNAIYGMMQAARAGIGIAMLPDYVTEKEDGLVQILPEVELPAYEAYFVYPPALKN